MAWTAPRTWVTGEVITASIGNTHWRDNFLETGPALVTTKGDVLIAAGANNLNRMGVGSNQQYLVADSAQTEGIKWDNRSPLTGGVVPLVIYKTADETVNNSTAFQDDDELAWTLAANTKWVWMLLLLFNSGATPDIKISWTVGAGAVSYARWGATVNSENTSPGTTEIIQGAAADVTARVYGVFEKDATPGALTLRWAQNTADVSDTKVLKGASIHAWQVA